MTASVENLLERLSQRLENIEDQLSRLTSGNSTSVPAQTPRDDSFFQRITEATSDIVVEARTTGLIEFISRSVRQLGYTPEEITGANGFSYIHPDDHSDVKELLTQIPTTHHAITTLRIRHADGHYQFFECRINHLADNDEADPPVIVIARDITQRLKIVKELQESLEEKDVLLKEIHHRVKNNLQIISSMLSIQSRYFEEVQVREVFRECQNRIKSMALVHETLYMSKRLANIEFSGYIKTLVQRLSMSYREASAKVDVTISIPEVTLHIDTAVACGLIVNELVTNSFKHAFPGKRRGEIWISLTQSGYQFSLSVRDNGIGLSREIDLSRTNSMGLQLVTTLSHQLNADMDLDKLNGTSVTLTFLDQPHGETR